MGRSGEETKEQNKLERDQKKKNCVLRGRGGEKLRKERVNRVTNAIEKSKRMTTNKIHWILQKGLQ